MNTTNWVDIFYCIFDSLSSHDSCSENSVFSLSVVMLKLHLQLCATMYAYPTSTLR